MDNEETDELYNEEAFARDALEDTSVEQAHVNTKYLKHYQNSIAQFAQHLRGADKLNGYLLPSFFTPNSYWTAEEKDLFFHALSVHSRLRPDLIAATVPGKTILDVCIYLDLLFEASSKDKLRVARKTFLPALEVSDEWVAFEEAQAGALAYHETKWDREYRDERRALALQDEKEAMRRHKHRSTKVGRDREEEKRRRKAFEDFQADQEARWERDDYMSHLDSFHLRIIDSILREAEEPSGAAMDDNNASDQAIHDMGPGNVPSDAMIDPDLLAISALHGESTQMHSSNETGVRIPQISRGFEECDLSQLSPRSRRRYKKRMYMRRKRAEASGNIMSQSFTKLKPKRKGAAKKARTLTEAKELDIVSPSPLADAQLETSQLLTLDFKEMEDKEEYFDLHAGKEEFEVSLAEGFSQHNEESGSDHHATSRNDTGFSQPHVSGLTQPYKVKDTILSYGFDAAHLIASGLGLFHLSNIVKLMKYVRPTVSSSLQC